MVVSILQFHLHLPSITQFSNLSSLLCIRSHHTFHPYNPSLHPQLLSLPIHIRTPTNLPLAPPLIPICSLLYPTSAITSNHTPPNGDSNLMRNYVNTPVSGIHLLHNNNIENSYYILYPHV